VGARAGRVQGRRPVTTLTGDAAPDRTAAPGRRVSLLAGVAALALALDQLTKWWAVSVLDDRTIKLVGSLQLQRTTNFAAAFSLGAGRGALIPLVAIVVVIILVRTGVTRGSKLGVIALALILGGALGNLTDRAFRAGDGFLGGGVVDFIDAQWWPVFNVADMSIVIGGGLVLMSSWREER
jgi:signal peptidase II